MICTGFCYKFNCCYTFWIYFQARYCLYCVFILSLLFCLPPAGPDDYVESTQEENKVIQILCDDDGMVEIKIQILMVNVFLRLLTDLVRCWHVGI